MEYEAENTFIPIKDIQKLAYLKAPSQLSYLGVEVDNEWVIIIDSTTGNDVEMVLSRKFINNFAISAPRETAISIKELLLLASNICEFSNDDKLLTSICSRIPLNKEKWVDFLIIIAKDINSAMKKISKARMVNDPPLSDWTSAITESPPVINRIRRSHFTLDDLESIGSEDSNDSS